MGQMPEWMDERSWRVERALEPLMLLAALLVIPSVIMEFHGNEIVRGVGHVLNVTIWTLFLLEVVVMLWVVPNRRMWMRTHILELAIVVLTAPLPVTGDSEWVRLLRLFRLLRLLHVGRLARRYLRSKNIDESIVVLVVVVVGGGAAIAVVEPTVGSTWEGIWRAFSWATVGEDLPQTTPGRVISAVILLLGIAFVSYLTGAIAANIVSYDREDDDFAERGAGDAGDASTARAELAALRREVGELRSSVDALTHSLAAGSGGEPDEPLR